MQYHVIFSIGREYDRDGEPIGPVTRDAVSRAIQQYVSDNFKGASIVDGQGIWSGSANGGEVVENVTVITTDVFGTIDEFKRHAWLLAIAARQKAVWMSMIPVYAVAVSNTGEVIE